MNPRLVILLGLAFVLAVVIYAKNSAKPTTAELAENSAVEDELTPEEIQRIRLLQTLLADRPLAGEEPPEPVELSAQVEVDRGSGKNRLCVYLTEAHGYYVETFQINAMYMGRDEVTGQERTPLTVPHYANKYLKTDDTLKECFEVVPAELARVGGDIGASENWRAEVASYGRARLENPDPLPPL